MDIETIELNADADEWGPMTVGSSGLVDVMALHIYWHRCKQPWGKIDRIV